MLVYVSYFSGANNSNSSGSSDANVPPHLSPATSSHVLNTSDHAKSEASSLIPRDDHDRVDRPTHGVGHFGFFGASHFRMPDTYTHLPPPPPHQQQPQLTRPLDQSESSSGDLDSSVTSQLATKEEREASQKPRIWSVADMAKADSSDVSESAHDVTRAPVHNPLAIAQSLLQKSGYTPLVTSTHPPSAVIPHYPAPPFIPSNHTSVMTSHPVLSGSYAAAIAAQSEAYRLSTCYAPAAVKSAGLAPVRDSLQLTSSASACPSDSLLPSVARPNSLLD